MKAIEQNLFRDFLSAAAYIVLAAATASADTPRTFEADVRPILKAHCFHCHGEEGKTEGELDVRLVRLLLAGGESGPALVAGKAGQSYLMERLESGEMPPGETKLSARELRVIREWIDQGARTTRPEPANADQLAFTEEERAFWSFQPVVAPPVPSVKAADRVRTPVDAFVLARLEQVSSFNGEPKATALNSEPKATVARLSESSSNLPDSESQATKNADASGLPLNEPLGFSPDADKVTLIRRAYFDLLGLPPSPEDVDAFLRDDDPQAWSKLLDRLLDSEHYGERWARHWLDVAGYADSDGYSEQDRVRESAWKYRDYVIRSLNADKPFDQFLVEQLAGDELVAAGRVSLNGKPQATVARLSESSSNLPDSESQATKNAVASGSPLNERFRNLSDADKDRLIATGFLRNAPDGTADRGVDQSVARNEVMADTINIVSTSLLGLSVGCARCHSHRFDPISHEDYHRVRAIFEPAYDWKNWLSPEDRRLSLWSDAERQLAEEVDAELAQAADERNKQLKRHRSEVLDIELAKLPAEVQAQADMIRDAVLNRSGGDRTPEQASLLKKYPKLDVGVGTLAQAHKERYQRELQEYNERVAEITARRPADDFVRALFETPGNVPVTHLFRRGSHTQPGEGILPGELSVLTRGDESAVPANNAELESTGRRLAYARHLTSGQHPLTARVLVNRIWMHHFGRGIVGTPSDFGSQGERPTHPELLDWLADHFVRGVDDESVAELVRVQSATLNSHESSYNMGWRLKTLHKLIMMSTVYRQASMRTEALDAVDPDNRLLGRMNLRRLDAETIRDTVLAVSGNLNQALYGPPLPVTTDGVGQVVIGTPRNDREGRVIPLKGDAAFRRSIYVQARRTLKLGMLDAFDAPSMTPNCEQRNSSTVASQSLLFMNNAEMLKQAEIFAERVVKEAGNDTSAQIRRAWRLALASEPTTEQIERSVAFLAAQKEFAAQRTGTLSPEELKNIRFAAEPKKQALATFCQFLLSNNAFLYVD